ncbi:hypothetical protein PPERSA_01378 [Pseudocohnilembus persalinus]|uniref:Uncharacterized protein n=1 Tax=Pseudocohnilembus persalinus TaxID=266149 RepID=A0A0V0QGS2_PSEPJ|nr:hypothetical protein PPERSA_01378 [Pseudocohnilembus persalinus]|eukprot:KRX01475.1 hypothetical protein PPERSA_01378 [Pseudocohnilembus persalinus]
MEQFDQREADQTQKNISNKKEFQNKFFIDNFEQLEQLFSYSKFQRFLLRNKQKFCQENLKQVLKIKAHEDWITKIVVYYIGEEIQVSQQFKKYTVLGSSDTGTILKVRNSFIFDDEKEEEEEEFTDEDQFNEFQTGIFKH